MPKSLVSLRSLSSSLNLFASAAVIAVAMLTPSFAAAQCTLNTTNPSVTICTPTNGSTVSSPVHVVAGTTDSNAISYLQIYLDGVKVYEVKAKSLDTNVTISTTGTHRLTVQAKDSAGAIFKQSISVTVGSAPPPPPPNSGGLSSIKHIFFMLQENRSFDNYFGQMGQYRKDRGFTDPFDGLPSNVSLKDKSGQLVQPYHFNTVCHENLSPGWNESHYDVNGGAMNNFMLTTGSVPSTIDPDGTRAMGYYDSTDLPYYYELAFQYATSDRFFSSVLAPTIPNRMYMFAATSFGHVRPDAAPSGGWTQPTIFDKLDAAGVSWRYYYQDNSVYLSEWSTWQRDSGKVRNISSYYTDIQNESTLPQVIFIERASQLGYDEHPTKNVQTGASKSTSKIIDALTHSNSWGSSAFILTFDEGGGLYDHVVPPSVVKPDGIAPILKSTDIKADFNQMGFRIPIMVVSPWVKPHYVSHTPMELTSILKFIEKRFGVGNLTQRDLNAPDMTEFFDFSSPHLLTPPPMPTQPTTGICDKTLEKAPGH